MNKIRQFKNNYSKVSIAYFILLTTMVVSSRSVYAAIDFHQETHFAQIMQQKKVTLDFKNKPIKWVLSAIYKQTKINFLIKDEQAITQELSSISLKVSNVTIEDVLKKVLSNTNFTFEFDGSTVLIFKRKSTDSVSQKKIYTVKGHVINERTKEPISGATILINKGDIGAISDAKGNFFFSVPEAKGLITVSFMGFQNKQIPYVSNVAIDVALQESNIDIDDVQVVAYGTQKKRTMVSSISSVDADDIKELPTHSLENLLQGHMAGVEINNMSGSPGGGGSIVAIRGYNSMMHKGSNNDDRTYGTPLYVVDGIPMQAFTSPITGTNTLSDIDPSMIESIEVLKDAASAAIYGSRAGNGVILITTKKGRKGKSMISANASYSASWIPVTPTVSGGSLERNYHLQGLRNAIAPYKNSGGDWVMPKSYEEVFQNKNMENGPIMDYFWGRNNGQDAVALQDSLNPFYNNSVDWWKKMYQIGSVYNANIQASGGGDNISYSVGLGYYKERGIVKNTGYERATALINLSATPVDFLRLDVQSSLGYNDRSRGPSAGQNASKIEGITADPMSTPSFLYPEDEGSILGSMNRIQEKNHGYAARLNAVLTLNIYKNLSLSVSGGADFNQQNQNVFFPKESDVYSHFSESKGAIGRNILIQNENILRYKFSFANSHNFEFLAGLSFEEKKGYQNTGSAKNGPDDLIHYVNGGWGDSNGLIYADQGSPRSAFLYSSDYEQSRMNSLFGRFSYNFMEKYMIEATVRRDGSSKFGENVRWATFPSVALGWAFSQEKFMEHLYWLSFGKVRVSYGTSGQVFFQNYLAHGLMTPTDETFHGNSGMTPDVTGGVINRDLSWETTHQWDAGVDLSLFNHRVKLTGDYYHKYTKGLLSEVELMGNTFYHNFQWRNAADISNTGIELEVSAEVFRKTQVKWRTKLNFSRNWNRFEKSYDGFDLGSYVIGKPLYNMIAFKTDGFYNDISEVPYIYVNGQGKQPLYSGSTNGVYFGGTRRIIDINGDGQIDADDGYYIGSPLPLGHGGWANEITWKNFDLNIMFTYSFGRNAIKRYDDFYMGASTAGNPIFVDVRNINTWKPGSTNADYPANLNYTRLQGQYSGEYDCDVEKVNLLRLKQITIGYNLDKTICSKIKLKSLRLFLTMENLFLNTNYSGLDPELIDVTNGYDNLKSYPLPRKFTLGLTANF